MPIRTAKQSVVVHREGTGRKIVAPGEVFDFTEEELSHLTEDAVSKVIQTEADDDGDKKTATGGTKKADAPKKADSPKKADDGTL